MKLLEKSPSKLTKHDEHLINSLQVLSDPTRFKIFKLLLNRRRELCVNEIARELGVSSSAVSQHFRIFELSEMVDKKRYGQKICYALEENNQLIKDLSRIITSKK